MRVNDVPRVWVEGDDDTLTAHDAGEPLQLSDELPVTLMYTVEGAHRDYSLSELGQIPYVVMDLH